MYGSLLIRQKETVETTFLKKWENKLKLPLGTEIITQTRRKYIPVDLALVSMLATVCLNDFQCPGNS